MTARGIEKGEIMGLIRYSSDPSIMRIERLLERLLQYFEGKKEGKEIESALADIEKSKDALKGGDFL